MSEPKAFRRFAQAAQKWRDLVERRRAHFIDLQTSGRWRHYYTQARFLALLQEAIDLSEVWAAMAPQLEVALVPEKPALGLDPGPEPEPVFRQGHAQSEAKGVPAADAVPPERLRRPAA
jgi:hypothetical protein